MFDIDPKILLEWLKGNVPWFVFVIVPLFFLLKWWGKLNWEALNGREKKPESYEWAIRQLKENNWGKNYLNALGWLLDKISGWIGDRDKLNQIYVTPANPKGVIHKTFGFNPFTPESYDKCLRLALIYPAISFVIAWSMGSNGQIGNIDFFGKNAAVIEAWWRWLTFGSVLLVIIGVKFIIYLQRSWLRLLLATVIFTGTIAIAAVTVNVGVATVAVAVAAAAAVGTGEFVVAFAGVFAFSVVGAFVGADVFASAGVLGFALASTKLVDVAQRWSYRWNKISWFWLFYTFLFIVFGYISLQFIKTDKHLILLLFWLVLPLVNAPLDWLSLGVTRGLLQAARAGHHGGWAALGFGLLDLGFALVFLFLIAAVLVLATALGNVVAGKTLVDLGKIFADLKADPWSVNHWWVYFMLLSTLVPTLVHFALAGGAATLWLPQKLRERIAHNLEQNHYKISAAWVYLTFTPAVGFVVAPALLLGLLYWLVTAHSGWFGGHLLDWAEWLTLTVNPPIAAGAQP